MTRIKAWGLKNPLTNTLEEAIFQTRKEARMGRLFNERVVRIEVALREAA